MIISVFMLFIGGAFTQQWTGEDLGHGTPERLPEERRGTTTPVNRI